MARTAVLKKSALSGKTNAELKEMLRERHAKVTGSHEELVQRLIEASYPVYPLPKARPNSVRGAILLSYVNADGTPVGRMVKDDEVVATLLERKLVENEQAGLVSLQLYKHNLVRYYGFTMTVTEEGTRFLKR